MGGPASVRAAGPLARVVQSDGNALTAGEDYRLGGYQFGPGTNALIILHRVAFFDAGRQKLDDSGQQALLRWAAGMDLGQDTELIGDVAARRANAVAALRRRGQHVVRLRAEPEWRLAVGLGNKANAHEIGLSLHGTYGWPVIPGSSLKGLAAAWAVASGADPAVVGRVLGSPRHNVSAPEADPPLATDQGPLPRAEAAQGTVRFLDALPAGSPACIHLDVLTPHVKPYYESTGRESHGEPVPPAEYHNPIPVNFLTVSGPFTVDLFGRTPDDVERAAVWLTQAGDELGAGAKTAAGYGYLAVSTLGSGGDQG